MTSLQSSCDFFAERAVTLMAIQRTAGLPDRRAFFEQIISPVVEAHGAASVGLLAHSLARLAFVANCHVAEVNGLTVQQVLDIHAADRFRREFAQEPEGT